MPQRGEAVLPEAHAPGLRDLGSDLARREDAPVGRLGCGREGSRFSKMMMPRQTDALPRRSRQGCSPPCPSFSSIIFTAGTALVSWNFSLLNFPVFMSRQPKYPVPIFHTKSPPGARWKREMPPSPVLWENPPMRAAVFRARTAVLLIAPKDMPDTLRSEAL